MHGKGQSLVINILRKSWRINALACSRAGLLIIAYQLSARNYTGV
jgi:hypothetical protein